MTTSTSTSIDHQTSMENQEDSCASINESVQPLATFAIITDIHYADADDMLRYDKKKMRYYRNSLNLVREAVKNWRAYSSAHRREIKFVIQFGDIIDGKCKATKDSTRAMNLVIDELNETFREDENQQRDEEYEKRRLVVDRVTGLPRLLHVWGNHEMYNFSRTDLLNLPLNTARELKQNLDREANYYTFDITPKLRLICLDFYKFSTLGYESTDAIYSKAIDYLRTHNKNEDLNSVEGMRGHALRFSQFNGSLGVEQLAWLRDELDKCRSNNVRVIVCGHLPIHAQAADVRCLAWDSKEVLECLWHYERTVIAYLAGHDHDGGYFRDKKNIHHLTLAGLIETPNTSNTYAFVNVYEDRVKIEGVGVVGHYEIFVGSDN